MSGGMVQEMYRETKQIMKSKQRIAVFASGNGSNYEAIMRTFQDEGWTKGEVALVVCDQPGAYVLKRAEKWGTPTFTLSMKDYPNKAAFETAILQQLADFDIDFLVLAGYMRLLGTTLLEPYLGKIINIHPSLLPAFPGKDAIGQALEYGVQVTGVTVHFVDEGMDTGPIIAQRPVQITKEDTYESLAKKIQTVEHELYPQVIKACVEGKVRFKGGFYDGDTDKTCFN